MTCPHRFCKESLRFVLEKKEQEVSPGAFSGPYPCSWTVDTGAWCFPTQPGSSLRFPSCILEGVKCQMLLSKGSVEAVFCVLWGGWELFQL